MSYLSLAPYIPFYACQLFLRTLLIFHINKLHPRCFYLLGITERFQYHTGNFIPWVPMGCIWQLVKIDLKQGLLEILFISFSFHSAFQKWNLFILNSKSFSFYFLYFSPRINPFHFKWILFISIFSKTKTFSF